MYFKDSYPVFISLKDCQCLIVGFGKVGQRKLAGLLPCAPHHVLVLDILPENCFPEDARSLLNRANVSFASRKWTEGDVEKSSLVFACSSDKKENSSIAALCAAKKILCNNVTNPPQGNFIVPALARQNGILAAIGTGGASPLLAGMWRRDLEKWLKPKAKMAWLMGRLRPEILALHQTQDTNKKIFLQIASSPLPTWLAEGKISCCREWLKNAVPQISSATLDKVFTDYAANFS